MTLPTFYTFVRLAAGCGVQRLDSSLPPPVAASRYSPSAVCSSVAAVFLPLLPVPPPCKLLQAPPRPLDHMCVPSVATARTGPWDQVISSTDLDSWEGEGACTVSRVRPLRPPLASALLQTRRMPGSAGSFMSIVTCSLRNCSLAAFVPHALRADGEGGPGRAEDKIVLFPVTRRGGSGWLFPATADIAAALFCILKPVNGRVKLSDFSRVTEFGRVAVSKRLAAHAPVLPASLPRTGLVVAREENRPLAYSEDIRSCGS